MAKFGAMKHGVFVFSEMAVNCFFGVGGKSRRTDDGRNAAFQRRNRVLQRHIRPRKVYHDVRARRVDGVRQMRRHRDAAGRLSDHRPRILRAMNIHRRDQRKLFIGKHRFYYRLTHPPASAVHQNFYHVNASNPFPESDRFLKY
jgi:hypothetical protein